MNHDDDDDKKLNRKLILEALDFLDLPGRLKLLQLPHLNLGYAELARRYVDYLKQARQWQPQYSPGRVYRLIEQGEIPTQFEMPAGSLELPGQEEKAWYSAEEADLIRR
jgi:hypothetical protein